LQAVASSVASEAQKWRFLNQPTKELSNPFACRTCKQETQCMNRRSAV
jgi:hypothetical protein